MASKTSPSKLPHDIQTDKWFLGRASVKDAPTEKTIRGSTAYEFETFARWVPLKRGPELIILTSA